MTNPTPHGQVPEALRLADELEIPIEGYPEATELERNAAAELRRLHAYCQELEAHVIRDCMTHVQNPAEIEHVAGDVPGNGAEVNMNVYAELPQSVGEHRYGGGLYTDAQMLAFADATHALRTQQPAPATQQAVEMPESIEQLAVARYKVVPAHESMLHRWAVVAGDGAQQLYLGREVECENMARKFAGAFLDGAFVAMQNAAPQPSPTAQADSQPAPVQSGLVATMLDALRHAQKVLNHNNLHMECGPVNAAILAACAPADSVLEDAARWTTEQEHAIRQGHEIAASDGYFEARPQIDCNDRRRVFKAGYERGWDAARKQGANHDNS